METVATETGARHPAAVAMAPPDVKAPRKMLGKPPGAVAMDTSVGEGWGFRGSGSVRAGGSGTALNTLSSERRTA